MNAWAFRAASKCTLNWYAHAKPENDRKTADVIGGLFGSKSFAVLDGGKVKRAV